MVLEALTLSVYRNHFYIAFLSFGYVERSLVSFVWHQGNEWMRWFVEIDLFWFHIIKLESKQNAI